MSLRRGGARVPLVARATPEWSPQSRDIAMQLPGSCWCKRKLSWDQAKT